MLSGRQKLGRCPLGSNMINDVVDNEAKKLFGKSIDEILDLIKQDKTMQLVIMKELATFGAQVLKHVVDNSDDPYYSSTLDSAVRMFDKDDQLVTYNFYPYTNQKGQYRYKYTREEIKKAVEVLTREAN